MLILNLNLDNVNINSVIGKKYLIFLDDAWSYLDLFIQAADIVVDRVGDDCILALNTGVHSGTRRPCSSRVMRAIWKMYATIRIALQPAKRNKAALATLITGSIVQK